MGPPPHKQFDVTVTKPTPEARPGAVRDDRATVLPRGAATAATLLSVETLYDHEGHSATELTLGFPRAALEGAPVEVGATVAIFPKNGAADVEAIGACLGLGLDELFEITPIEPFVPPDLHLPGARAEPLGGGGRIGAPGAVC